MSDGSRPPLAGRAPVFADTISAVYEDMPKAIGAAFFATVVLVFWFRVFSVGEEELAGVSD